MISFIIIGKNEDKTIALCINSVLHTIKYNNYNKSEIIYVDSKSTDNTLNIVKSFKEVKIFEITGVCNAAVARNIGAIEAKNDILCFIDGDMELQKEFLPKIIKNNKLTYPFISGQLQNIFYNNKNDWKLIDSNFSHRQLNNDKYFVTTGGYFFIDRKLWFLGKGMKTKYRRSQDLDLGLRLAKKGIKLLRKKELMVKHHTIDYQNNQRMWKMLFDGSLIYQTSVLYRDHLFNINAYKIIVRQNYTLLILFISILLSFYDVYFMLMYFISAIMRGIMQKKIKNGAPIFIRIIHRILNDFFSFMGFFIFFPKSNKLEYKKQ